MPKPDQVLQQQNQVQNNEPVFQNRTDDSIQLNRGNLLLDPVQVDVLKDAEAKAKEKKAAKKRLEKYVEEENQRFEREKRTFDAYHSVANHSTRFANMVQEARYNLGRDMSINTLSYFPDQKVLYAECKERFTERISFDERRFRKKNKKSRLYIKNRNVDVMDVALSGYDQMQAKQMEAYMEIINVPYDKEDYRDIRAFMDKKRAGSDRHIIRKYFGESNRRGPGGYEGQDIQGALDLMANRLFTIDIRKVHLENDKEMAERADFYESILNRVTAFDRLCAKHNYLDSLKEHEREILVNRLDSLRSIAAYYQVRKEIMHNAYYKEHYNDELSMDVLQAETEEQKELAKKLMMSCVLAKSMMEKNRVDHKDIEKIGEPSFANEDLQAYYDQLKENYSKSEVQKEFLSQAYLHSNELKEQLAAEKKKELEEVNYTMKRVMDKAFVPVTSPGVRTGTWSKIKNRMMIGARWLWGFSGGLVAAVAMNLSQVPEAVFTTRKRTKDAQEKRRHDMVPGREGETFESFEPKYDENGEEEIYGDYRRGPLVWEKITAGDPEDPPEVILMTRQPEEGNPEALTGIDNEGHAMLGLTYSRYNKSTKRKERYQLRIGFYPGVKQGSISSGLMQSVGTIVPGQIRNDEREDFAVARRYQVKNGDINRILKASMTYADKGYGMFKRNCSTFVMDMAKLANIPLAKEVKEGEMSFSTFSNFLLNGVVGSGYAGYLGGVNIITEQMTKRDLSYQNFGQKIATKDELRRYKETAFSLEVVKRGYSPAALGEELRRDGRGDLLAKFDEKTKAERLNSVMLEEGGKLWNVIKSMIGDENGPEEETLNRMLNSYGDGGLYQYVFYQKQKPTPNQMREAHKEVSSMMRFLNKYYREKLGSDARINPNVLDFLSLCELALTYIDEEYRNTLLPEMKGDVGKNRFDFTMTEYEMKFKDDQGQFISTKTEPGVLEGYLIAGYTAKDALLTIKKVNEYIAMDADQMTKAQKNEYTKLKITYDLARDFAKANRYLLEKETVDDKDITYAFVTLQQKECEGGLSGELIQYHSPATIYQSVIYEKIFSGIGELHLDQIQGEQQQKAALDTFLMNKVGEKPELMDKILRAFLQSEGADKELGFLSFRFVERFLTAFMLPAYNHLESPYGFTGAMMMAIGPRSRFKTYLEQRFAAFINNQGGNGN